MHTNWALNELFYFSGESAFHSLMSGFAWAKEPMYPRIAGLDARVPLTAIYGRDSWVDSFSEEKFKQIRPNGVYTKTKVKERAFFCLSVTWDKGYCYAGSWQCGPPSVRGPGSGLQ